MCIYTSLRQRHLPMDGYPKPQSLIIARNYQMSRFDQIWELRDYYKHLISINSNQGLPMFYHICSMKAKILSMMCARKVGATRHRCTYLRCRVLSTNGVRSLSIDISTKLSCEGLRPSAARKTMDSHQTGKGWNNLSDESSFSLQTSGSLQTFAMVNFKPWRLQRQNKCTIKLHFRKTDDTSNYCWKVNLLPFTRPTISFRRWRRHGFSRQKQKPHYQRTLIQLYNEARKMQSLPGCWDCDEHVHDDIDDQPSDDIDSNIF